MYDIAIIGGGPAGATLARLLGKKYKVLLVDRRLLDQSPREGGMIKSCGGLLAPDAQKILARLGLGLPRHIMTGPQIFVVRTIDLQSQRERYYQRFYFNFDREKFDRWLISLLPDQVDLASGTLLRSFQREKDSYRLQLRKKGETVERYARVLIGADGANSKVRQVAFPNDPVPPRYIAIQERFAVQEASPYFSAIFDREITDFYAWTIPKDEELIVGAALKIGVQAREKFQLLKDKLHDFGFDLSTPLKREGAFILRPKKQRQICIGKDQIGLIGEAAGWISPSSAEGLSYAMLSGLYIAEALRSDLIDFLPDYKRRIGKLRRNIFLKNVKAPFMYHPFLRNSVMCSGLQSVDIAGFQDSFV